jgi:hypothetical protein
MKQVAAVLALSALIALPAMAEPQDANDPVVVRDATNAIVGRLLSEGSMARRIRSSWAVSTVSIAFSQQGLDNNFVFFYGSPDCSGQPYIETFFFRPVPDRAVYEQATLTLWEGDPNTQITLNANSATYGSGACDPTVVQTIIASPAIAIDNTSHGFTPPFRAE